MHRAFAITAGAFAVAVLFNPSSSFARNEAAVQQGEQPSATHGVQGAHDAGMAKMPTTAKDFVSHAAQDGMAEVALGKIAVERAQDADVKQFAQKMVDDHSKANQELMSLATSKGMQPPAEPTAAQKADSDRLSKLSGAAFDKAYMQHMVGDHDKAVATFRTFSERGDDAELKQWAEKTLPTLQEHERLAKTTAAKVGASARTSHSGKKSHAMRTSQR